MIRNCKKQMAWGCDHASSGEPRGTSEHQLKAVHKILVPVCWGQCAGSRLVISVWSVQLSFVYTFFDMLLYPLFYLELCKYNFTFVPFGAKCFNTGMIHRTNLKGQELTPIWENRSSEHGSGSQECWVVLLAQTTASCETVRVT